MIRMRAQVREHNIYRWAALLLSELGRMPQDLGGGLRPPSPSEGASTAPSETSPRPGLRGRSPRSNLPANE